MAESNLPTTGEELEVKNEFPATGEKKQQGKTARNFPIASNTRDFPDNIHVKSTNRLESLHYIFNVPAQRKITIARSHVNSHMVLKP